jgi:TonB-linked SusC/RagA family outer membrane protein
VLAAVPLPLHAQSGGTITGRVIEASTGAATAVSPIAGAQVSIPGTNLGATTDQDGRFTLSNVPAGTHVVRATAVGHAQAERTVTVAAGRTAQIDIRLESQALQLAELVVTGVAGATSRAKVPFTISKVTADEIQVLPVTAGTAIQGKVAGAMVVSGSGRPGSAPSILLRGPTSIDASGRSQEPLYIVDGVILGSSLTDIDAADIESIEVVKGAAAASLYGSRAANGVIQITTRHGARADNTVHYTARSQYGKNELAGDFLLTKHHQYALENGKFVDSSTGEPCDFLTCPHNPRLAGQAAGEGVSPNQWNTFMTQVWPGQTYDQVDRFFQGGDYMENYIAADGRNGGTSFHVSFSNLDQEGIMRGMKGFTRNNFRVNLDQSVRDNVQVTANAFYSRSTQGQFPETNGNPLFDLTRMPAGVNLAGCEGDQSASCLDDLENLVLLPDPTNTESANPLYEMLTRQYTEDRGRFLGGTDLRYTPVQWLDLSGNVSYDRLDLEQRDYFPKGFRTISPGDINDGYLDEYNQVEEAFNASASATFRPNLGSAINNTTTLQYLYERQDLSWDDTNGYGFAVADVPTLSNLDPTKLTVDSYDESVRSDGYYAISDFDILDRYTLSGLVRNDGSSLFGKDQRRQWYYRLAGAWRLTQEPWFALPGVNELKLHYAYGTAGSRPRFNAQYETFSVSGGRVTPVTLGNSDLKPEFSAEHEAGVDAAFLNQRVTLAVAYAKKRTENQILRVPLPAYSGYTLQWQNAGTLESNTWEGSLDVSLVRARDFNWSVRLLGDRTRATITELDRPAFPYGVTGQGLGNVFYARPGEQLGTFYGTRAATSCADLPSGIDCGQFAVNDDGYLVWTGGGSLSDNKWGTAAPFNVSGKPVMWGTPIKGQCTDASSGERTTFCPVGNSLPDYSLSFSSTMGWRGFSLYGLLDAVQGFDVYDQPLQWAVFKRTAGLYDQAGVPQDQQKPLGYYDALYAVSGLAPSTVFVEDASFVKLREVALRYHVGANSLARISRGAFSGLTLSLTGRNLVTWTDYRGYDPEVGKSGGDTGSAVLARVEGYQYPNFRTWILGAELNF